MGAGWRFWWQCSHHVAALLSLTLSLWFFFFLILSSDCSITGRGSGGLDGHDFSAGPQTSLSHLPTVEPPSQSLCTLLSARHKPGGQNPTAKTLVVIPPTGGTKSSSPITTLETWRCLPLGDRDSLLSTARRLDGPELNFLSSGSTLPCDPSSPPLPLMVTGCDRGSAFEERTFTFCEGYSPVTFLCFFFFFFYNSIHSFVARWDRCEVSTQSELEAAVAKCARWFLSWMRWIVPPQPCEWAVFMNRGDPAETEREHFREYMKYFECWRL